MDGFRHDLRQALRMIRRHRGFAAVVIATLAVAIGLDTAVFSVVDALLLRPPPVAAPERLVNVYSAVPGGLLSHAPMAFPDYEEVRDRARSFAGVVAYAWYPLALDRPAGAELVMAELVTGNYFETLGVGPGLGRVLAGGDDSRGTPSPVVVLGHDAWQRLFAGAPDVLGRTLRLNGRVFTVVGVAPAGFHGLIPGFTPDLWLPIHTGAALPTGVTINFGGRTPGVERTADRASRWVWVTGRLREGVSASEAAAEVALLGARLAREAPASHARRAFVGVPANAVRLLPGLDDALHAGSLVVVAIFSLVLAIAAVNLAGLFLARALTRRQEIATRLALGAGRSRLVRQLGLEGLVLVLLGGAAGLGVADVANRLFPVLEVPLAWPVRLAFAPTLDLPALLFALAAVAFAAVLFALVPAIEASRIDLAGVLRELGGATPAGRAHRARGALVAVQVAISTLLLVGAGLALRSLWNASRVDPGFAAGGVAVATVSPDLAGYEAPALHTYFHRLADRVAALPGVRGVALASHLPLTFALNQLTVAAADRDGDPETWPTTDGAVVGPGYFATLQTPLLSGREFSDRDVEGAPGIAVVNESLARRLWPGEPALGRRLRLAGADGTLEVVGVARDGKYRTLGERPRPFLFLCLGQSPRGTQTLVVRADGDLQGLLPRILEVARGLDPQVPVGRPTTLDEALGPVLFLPRAAASVLGAFGVLALVLAGLGIYGVVAFIANGRVREVGLRMALGADRGQIVGWILGRGLRAVAVGLAAGLALAAASTWALASVLYGIRPYDPPTFLGVGLLLALVAVGAAFLPARRAARLEPSAALRHE